ncbi:Cystathionine gamma-lyase [Lactobacillus delbrueckii subsp. bulgaricus CNCM I-1519]
MALDGNLLPGETLTYLTGMPYDTMQQVIGLAPKKRGTLIQKGINFSYVPLNEEGGVDYEEAEKVLKRDQPHIVVIQRSRCYDTRQSYTVDQIKKMTAFVKKVSPESLVFVDNCYGEFSEKHEPTEYGVDFTAGSLIKNAGGGIAQTGGYIVGKEELVENAAIRLTAPGIGKEEGATLTNMHEFYEGFFLAPHTTGEAIKGMIFSAALLEKMGCEVTPKWHEPRTDLIQTIIFNDPEKMINFTKEVQKNSLIDSFVEPIPSDMPG